MPVDKVVYQSTNLFCTKCGRTIDMLTQIFALVVLMAAAHAGGIGLGLSNAVVDLQAPAKYEFRYGITDPNTGDRKEQSEVRVGDVVKGGYSVAEPDGTIRVVQYTADDHNGFNAVVSRIGQAVHPPTVLVSKGLGLGGIGLAGGIGLGGIGLGH